MGSKSKPRRARRSASHRFTAESLSISGIDLSSDCSDKVDCIKGSGKSFVARYYASPTSKKILTKSEAKKISNAGMSVVAVWEDGTPTSGAYFSYSEGVDDGTSAYNMAAKIGQPANTPIHFAVDYDAIDEDITGSINDYFRGLRDGFKTISGGAPVHSIGVYGSGAVCSWLLARSAATYSWLAQSTGWRGYKDLAAWNIKQYAETSLCNLDVDTDEAVGDYGGFKIT
jgi:Domain of unknown function (DUF1906)